MKFYNKVNGNEVLFDSTGKNKLCEFVKGECEISDIKIAEKLIHLKQISYSNQEFERFKEGVKMGLCGFNRVRREKEEAEKKKKVTELMQDNVIEEKPEKIDKSEKIKEVIKVEEVGKLEDVIDVKEFKEDKKSTKSKNKKVDDK